MFTNQLNNQVGLVILFGQVIDCTKMTNQHYCITFSDNFDNAEFWWHHEISIGVYVEVFGTYTRKIYKQLKFHKIFAKRIKLFESSNQYMMLYLETKYEQQLRQQELQNKKSEPNFVKNIVASSHSSELTTKIVTKCIQKIGTKFLNGIEFNHSITIDFKSEDFENIIASEDEKSFSIQVLNYIGVLNGQIVNHLEICNLINFAKNILTEQSILTIQDCTKKLNDFYSLVNYEIFTEDISVCLFNLFLMNYICLQNSKNTIISKQ